MVRCSRANRQDDHVHTASEAARFVGLGRPEPPVHAVVVAARQQVISVRHADICLLQAATAAAGTCSSRLQSIRATSRLEQRQVSFVQTSTTTVSAFHAIRPVRNTDSSVIVGWWWWWRWSPLIEPSSSSPAAATAVVEQDRIGRVHVLSACSSRSAAATAFPAISSVQQSGWQRCHDQASRQGSLVLQTGQVIEQQKTPPSPQRREWQQRQQAQSASADEPFSVKVPVADSRRFQLVVVIASP